MKGWKLLSAALVGWSLLAAVADAAESASDEAAKPVRIAAPIDGHIHPSICLSPRGVLVVIYGHKNHRDLRITRSPDGGRTWSEPIPIGKGSGVRLDAETDVIALRDGRLYAALRGDRVPMHYATSSDEGLTWSAVQDIGFPGHCPHFTRLSTGEILLCHRLPLTSLHVSRDDGATWQGPCQVDTTPGAYPSTVELKDGTVLIVYYEEGERSAVRARRFRLSSHGPEFLELKP